MKAKSSGMIGVILGDLADPYSCQALKGLEDAAGSQNIQVMVAGSGMNFNSEKEIVERMLKMGAEGFIIQSTYRFGMISGPLCEEQPLRVRLPGDHGVHRKGLRGLYDVLGRFFHLQHGI